MEIIPHSTANIKPYTGCLATHWSNTVNPSYHVFIYGSLKTGHERGFLSEYFLGPAVTKESYGMLNLKSFPAMVQEHPNIPKDMYARVVGELIEVPKAILGALDGIESHPEFYQREEIKVINNKKEIKAWAYFLNKSHYKDGKILYRLIAPTSNRLEW